MFMSMLCNNCCYNVVAFSIYHMCLVKVLHFVYCLFWLFIFLFFYTVGILWTAKEECQRNMFFYCAYDNKHFESLILESCEHE